MGPFSYFPEMKTEEARAVHVLNRELMTQLLASSGYGFAIAAPTCVQVPFEEQTRFFELLKTHYELRSTEPNFGQNATTLLVLTRRDAQKGTKE